MMLFAVVQRPADDVRRARGAEPAAVRAVRRWRVVAACSARRRRSSTSCSARSRRRSSSTASRWPTATPAASSSPTIDTAVTNRTGGENRCCSPRSRLHGGRPAVQDRRRAVPHAGRPTSTRARRRRSRPSWPRAPRRPRSSRCCACSSSPSAGRRGTGGRCIVGRRGHHDVRRRGRVDLADRRQAHAGVLLDRARRLPAGRLRPAPTWVSRIGPAITSVSSVLFYLLGLRRRLDRRVRGRDGRARLRRRDDAPVEVGRARQGVAVAGRLVRALHAVVRGHPAHRRLHRQVGRVQRGLGAAASGRWSSSASCAARSRRTSTSGSSC